MRFSRWLTNRFRWTPLTQVLAFAAILCAQTKPRARDLGVPFDGTPGPNNAITDVKRAEGRSCSIELVVPT